MRLLVVEDDPEVQAFLLRVLREAAWAVDAVPSGQRALDALASTEYDLAIVDVGLPDFDGFEVCRRLRARSRASSSFTANGLAR
jgi:DNA-binding response OmpR family regulator